MASFVYIVLAGAGTFAEMETREGDSVSSLAKRACAEFSHWRVNAGQIFLYLAAAGGEEEPSEEALSVVLKGGRRLGVAWSLARAGIASGAWLVARNITDGSASVSRAHSPRERLRALLAGGGITIEERVMSTMTRSGHLSSRALTVSSVEDAIALYAAAEATPRTSTRAILRRELDVIVDGDMAVPGAQTAQFFHALKGRVPRVLKVPCGSADKAVSECELYVKVSAQPIPQGVFLVPVELLDMRSGSSHVVPGCFQPSHVKPLRRGVLMPAYAGTLARFPAPMSAAIALEVASRLVPTLRFLHASGWLHGDVKPGNIFLDFRGDAWLGDYGSSVPLGKIEGCYTGGTPAFQCSDLVPAREPLRCDLAGLAVSLLVQLGALRLEDAACVGWPIAALQAALARVEDAQLRQELAAMLE